MNMKKYKKIASFLDKIRAQKGENAKTEKHLVNEFAKKCYPTYKADDGLKQAKKFLKVLFGDNLGVLVKEGCLAALKVAATNAPDVMRIVRLNKPVGGFHKKLAKYYIGDTLGKGATSVVKLGKNEETGKE